MRAFTDRVVLITGASAGIGAALALELARRGADLALAARRTDRLEAIAALVRGTGRRAVVIRTDVTRPGDPLAAVRQTLSVFGRLDIVIANAGFTVAGRVDRLTLDDYRRQFETNVFGVISTIQAALPALTKTRGSVVLMGSIAGHFSAPVLSAYSMSKFAVRALADALRDEMRASGVSVTLISPGLVQSELRRVDRYGVFDPDRVDPAPAWLQMPTELAAEKIADAVARRRPEAIITGHGKALVWMTRHVPRIVRRVTRLFPPRRTS